MFIKRWWRSIDQSSVICIFLLQILSLVLITTAGPAVASRIGISEFYFASRQLLYTIVGIILMIIVSNLNRYKIKNLSLFLFIVCIILLILVKIFGVEVKGSKRWISIMGFSMQPTEFMKPVFAVTIGWILALKYSIKDFPSVSISVMIYILLTGLIALQPDIGTCVTIACIFCCQLFLAGIPLLWIVFSLILLSFGIFASYSYMPHVQKRINAFLDPENNENYQVQKSLLAFEHGGFYGKGPGEGTVKQVLPDSHTDFIFAVAGEELGGLVCLMINIIFMYIVVKGMIKLLSEEDKFAIFACGGILAQIAAQSMINMGVALNLLPTKGMTLPFISYGGSSTMGICLGFGMFLGITKKVTDIRFKFTSKKMIYD